MKIIKHRVNTIEELASVEPAYGVEIDLRNHNGELILAHDPFSADLVHFIDWLKFYHHDMIVLNIKEEGLETKILEVVSALNVQNFFFLDQSFPFLFKTLISGESRTAIRFSDLESIDTVTRTLNMSVTKPKWLWIDSFSGEWSHLKELDKIKSLGLNVCLASPELHGRNLDLELREIRKSASARDIDSVCTKFPEKWLFV